MKSLREKALQERRRWLQHKDRYCIVDTETTGLGRRDRVIEIAIIDLDGNVLLDTLVNPEMRVSPDAERIHGISNRMLEEAPDLYRVQARVREILENRIMLAYNAQFDARMIRQTFNFRVEYECLMQNVMKYENSSKYISLAEATYFLRREEQEHRALGDCYLCLKLIKNIGEDEDVDVG